MKSIPAVLLLVTVAASASAETVCEWIRQFKGPQPVFFSIDDPLPLQIAHIPHLERVDAHAAPSGNYSHFNPETAKESSIGVVRGGDTDLRMSVSEYSHRPLTAKWINAKLLLVELSINPHAGAYWIVDVEKELVVATEAEHDGTAAWNQCHQAGDG